MKSFFMRIKERMTGSDDIPDDLEEGYVELSSEPESRNSKINVKNYTLEDFSDTKGILDSLREGYTIAFINIKPLKDQDLVELKRAINKLKKTCDAINGDIAGFGEDWICITPSFAQIHRAPSKQQPEASVITRAAPKQLEEYDY